LCNVFVADAVRRQGIGEGLVAAAIAWADREQTRLWLRVVPGLLVSWYAKFGFQETGEVDGEYLWMEWKHLEA